MRSTRRLWGAFVWALVVWPSWAQDARSLFEDAERAQIEESYARAVELYKASLVKNPSYFRPMVGLAESYFALDEYEEALRYVREARKYAREDTAFMNLEGRIQIGLGDLSGAAALFAEVLAREPNNLEARFGQAELDVASGRKRQAATRYVQSLQVAPNNRKALVSLALLYEDLGERDVAARYVDLALRFHSADPQVHYAAARQLAPSQPARAMEHLELALSMKEGYRDAAVMLARLALNAKDPAAAAALATRMIARDRKDAASWYLLGAAQEAAGRATEAVNAYGSALQLAVDYEAARIALEGLAMDRLPLGDAKRRELAAYHSGRGDSLRQKHLLDKAFIEYRRALMLDPEAVQARVAFASIYRANGLPRKYLKELEILESLGKADADLLNEIEVRSRELAGGVAAKWKVDQYAIEHQKRSLLVVGAPAGGTATGDVHLVKEDAQLVRYLRETMLRYDNVELADSGEALQSFDQAFRAARADGIDYFLTADFSQTDRSFEIAYSLHLGRTGTALGSGRVYRTGNDRVRDAAAAAAEAVVRLLPVHGVLLVRDFALGLVDLGAAQGLEVGQVLSIVKQGTTRLLPPTGTLTAREEDQLGTFTVERLDENVAEGRIATKGFFDRINARDEVIVAPVAPPTAPPAAQAPQGLLQRLFGVRAAP